MKSLNDYINEEKKTTGAGATEMIKTIIDQLKLHNDCKYDEKKGEYVGKDKDLWQGAGQFMFDYLKELSQAELTKIVKDMNWESMVRDINDIQAVDVQICMAHYAKIEII